MNAEFSSEIGHVDGGTSPPATLLMWFQLRSPELAAEWSSIPRIFTVSEGWSA